MIKYVKRKDLDVIKYDDCIEKSKQSRIYAFSWYLDIVTDNWDVLVLYDYKAVMPISWRKKFGIKYVYPPFWLIELGVFSLVEKVDLSAFYKVLLKNFRFVETKLNTDLPLQKKEQFLVDKKVQILTIQEPYEAVFNNYRKDRKKDIIKAKRADLTEKWQDNHEKLIQLFKNNVGKRTPFIIDKDYQVLENLIKTCIQKRVGEILSIYNKENELVASGFFLKHKKCVTILVSSTDFEQRKNGENTFLIDRAIFKYQKNFKCFNFGGSSITSIAKYFLSFGSKNLEYQQIKYNNLPFLLKLFKR